jgi:ketosteroid isomerase-like protein
MSQENVEAVRRAIEVFNRDGPEAAAAFMDSEIEWHDMPEQPDAGVHHGREGFLEAVEQFTGGFEGFQFVVDEIFDHSDQVITYNRTFGRGTGSGATFEQRGACVWTLRNGTIVRVEWFGTRREALKAVGLEE